MSFFTRRRQQVDDRSRNIPPTLGNARLYQDHIPSFMSVYNVEDTHDTRGPAPSIAQVIAPAAQGPVDQPLKGESVPHLQHKHCDSTSTQTSESTDSSPTTTISTVDSASLTDPSPSSSPESPISVLPLSSFGATHLGIQSLQDLRMNEAALDTNKALSYERPLTSPSPRRPRNAKGLALKLPGCGVPHQFSEPSSPSVASPSFIKPAPMKPRKKPSNLSLQTSATAFNPRTNIEPPTPGFQPEGHSNEIRQTVLRHHHSSPQIMFSPNPRTGGPVGGMQLPDFQRSKVTGLSSVFRRPTSRQAALGNDSNETIYEEDSPIRTQMATRSMGNMRGDETDIPHSQEDAKSPGYPNGPVAIYEPNVYLYLEPTADEARDFDVVINVADDVKNPFEVEREKARQAKEAEEAARKNDAMDVDNDFPEPTTALSTMTFKTAFEFQPGAATPTETTPTTPKATATRPEPEYIHVPWQHGTDISRELLSLCEVIDQRVKEGKKVLVHCLQGQSRSASLIIAYGIYMNPDLTVNESYHAAQAKSRWISPNMKLMYALNDYRKLLHQKMQAPGGYKGRTSRSPTKHRTTLSADAIDYSAEQPHTAPLPSERESSPRGSSPPRPPSRPRGNSTPAYGDISPGPSSAPSTFSWVPKSDGPTPENNYGLWTKDTGFFSSSQPSTSVTSKIPTVPQEPKLALAPPPRGFGSHRKLHQSSDRETPAARSNRDVEMTESPEQPLRAAPPPPFVKGAAVDDRSPPVTAFTSQPSLKQQFATLRAQPTGPPSPALWSPRIQEMNGPHFGFPTIVVNEETSGAPSIMSPRANFTLHPVNRPSFSITQNAAASFGFGFMSVGPSAAVPSEQDPRSPPTKGEAPILRSIDDMV